MLKLDNITKIYNKTTILNKLNITIQDNITGIIAPNGAGKSTLLNILSGIDQNYLGNIYFQNNLLNTFESKKNIFSYMLEDLTIYPFMKVYEFIEFIEKTTNYIDSNLKKILKLESVLTKSILSLSKGYHQRLKLFFALNNTKPIILLDEPFDGFDPFAMQEILKLIKYRSHIGQKFILSIHQLFDAQKICQNYILLNHGNIIAHGNLINLQQQFNLKQNSSLEDIFIKALTIDHD